MDERRSMKRPSVHTHVARRRVPAAAVLAVAVVLALAGFAAARYVMQQQQDGLATATDCYFTIPVRRASRSSCAITRMI